MNDMEIGLILGVIFGSLFMLASFGVALSFGMSTQTLSSEEISIVSIDINYSAKMSNGMVLHFSPSDNIKIGDVVLIRYFQHTWYLTYTYVLK